ncbi:permease [Cronobacter sp. EKM101R]|uniref:permease n=1 Tax=Cronobacter TaxID=413496 RepID=UPI0013EC5CEB|nr:MULTISPECIES: permease [Cronobacter]KAF6590691.1 permease [Cronobacter sp. EKM101R]KAF6593166.1 permease [Cronobacter sp. EKM102R]MDK1186931.1 permease [Cronobacter turicensis]MDK1191333.1 permease [Cronobacter dublinensis]MDK1201972.1 permease [Cronobacter dublinensis]
MFSLYIKEAGLNIKENKSIFTFVFFLLVSFTGITVTDSLIFSVSRQAESELKINGDNVISIKLNIPVNKEKIYRLLYAEERSVFFEKSLFVNIGESPFSEQTGMIVGLDRGMFGMPQFNIKNLSGDEIILNQSILNTFSKPVDYIFINGIPFKITGVLTNKKTDFLDSLGLTEHSSRKNYIVPLDTVIRFSLDSSVDYVYVVFNAPVSHDDISSIDALLKQNGVKDYSIMSYLDAEETVERVINRFSTLVNIIYILLTFSSIVVIIVLSQRLFRLRCTEFALKIIHGVNKRAMLYIIVLESMLTVYISTIISFIFSSAFLFGLSVILHVDLHIRFFALLLSLTCLSFVCIITNVVLGRGFFSKRPIDLIKGRML